MTNKDSYIILNQSEVLYASIDAYLRRIVSSNNLNKFVCSSHARSET